MTYPKFDRYSPAHQMYVSGVNTGCQRIAASVLVLEARPLVTVITAGQMLKYLKDNFPEAFYDIGLVSLYMGKMTFFGWLKSTKTPGGFLVTVSGKAFGERLFKQAEESSTFDVIPQKEIPRDTAPAKNIPATGKHHPALAALMRD